MSSLSFGGKEGVRAKAEGLAQLLDPVVGFFVWTVHFLTVYVATAVACVLGLGTAGTGTRSAFLATLALVTAGAAALTLLHALRRYRQQREVPELYFKTSVTIGCDAIATVAIIWQLFPLLLVPVCA